MRNTSIFFISNQLYRNSRTLLILNNLDWLQLTKILKKWRFICLSLYFKNIFYFFLINTLFAYLPLLMQKLCVKLRLTWFNHIRTWAASFWFRLYHVVLPTTGMTFLSGNLRYLAMIDNSETSFLCSGSHNLPTPA